VNRAEDETRSHKLVLPWPLRTIKPRSREDNEVRRIGYFGDPNNLHPFFMTSFWADELQKLGCEWVHRGIDAYLRRPPADVRADGSGWNDGPCYECYGLDDYSDVDAVVTFRPLRYHEKPPAKTINAWAAGVIPVLGNDMGAESLCTHGMNALVCSTPNDAVLYVRMLIEDPGLRARLFEGVSNSSKIHGFDGIRKRWEGIFEWAVESAKRRWL
jgi:hypothetical protein